MTQIDPIRAWQSTQARDAAADGSFVYAVRTTGIYCRPSCPSRRPAPQNVAFYATPAEARAAGFRACHRCRPDRQHPRAVTVRLVCDYLDRSHETTPTLAAMAKIAGMHPTALQKAFRETMGISPREYFENRRKKRFRRELGRSETVTEAAYEAGFSSSSRAAAAKLGMTPRTYLRRGERQTIRYTLSHCVLGRILVAATQRGICAVAFADTDRELIADLKQDFARAELVRDDDALKNQLTAVLGHLRENPVLRELSLDVRATAFQQRVWDALTKIPRGEVRSYGELAHSLGQPAAARAVARACASNPVAMVVPCHRVIGKDGSLTGYRWGVERKRKLLEMEWKTGSVSGPKSRV